MLEKKYIKKIILFNTAISSLNVGDYIIMQSCNKVLKKLHKQDFFVEIPTHTYLNFLNMSLIKKISICIFVELICYNLFIL
ncbi:hypothetical protein C4N19_00395 [Fusobacterium mortiferum ATCC 9817]|uniref:Uncharacterized protein n=1 Tax=Fusobacterium mortiferum ATCC 9817 TaxID=469616 RepID=A0ABN5J543_FUSMR|nr:hypothetical protein C4N19_00395 [Fusobacterium mortiferum ATCC 9817]